MGDTPEERNQDEDTMLWFILKPVRPNIERIVATTKAAISNSKDRAKVFGEELSVVGSFLDEKAAVDKLDPAIVKLFW